MYLSALNCVHLTSIGNLLTHINGAEIVYRVDQKLQTHDHNSVKS